MGVESIRDIPDDFELSEIQRRAATCVQTGEPWFSPELGEVLSGLKYPLYFADFETVNPAIPRFAGMRPYDQIAFSVVCSCAASNRDAEPEHYEFLATDAQRSPARVHPSLCAALGESGSIVVYSAFESQRLSELAAWLPEFAERIKRDPSPPVGFAACRARARLPSGIRRVVLACKSVLACARAGDDLRGHGGREWAGCRAGLGIAGAWEAWIRPSATGSGGRCWIIAGRTRWRWSDWWENFGWRRTDTAIVASLTGEVKISKARAAYDRFEMVEDEQGP